eukprot:2586395-Rhodomonas_salina.1
MLSAPFDFSLTSRARADHRTSVWIIFILVASSLVVLFIRARLGCARFTQVSPRNQRQATAFRVQRVPKSAVNNPQSNARNRIPGTNGTTSNARNCIPRLELDYTSVWVRFLRLMTFAYCVPRR